jgi:hypothetical protein
VANAFGLEECPQVRGLDILSEGFGLGALAERLRQRETQRDDRDQKRDLPVLARGFLGLVGLLHAFMRAHDSLPCGAFHDGPNDAASARGTQT